MVGRVKAGFPKKLNKKSKSKISLVVVERLFLAESVREKTEKEFLRGHRVLKKIKLEVIGIPLFFRREIKKRKVKKNFIFKLLTRIFFLAQPPSLPALIEPQVRTPGFQF